MAIIYTYPKKNSPTASDLILISDASDNKTKQASITDFPIVSDWSAGDTGFLPSEKTTGSVELKGTLNVDHGGTGIGDGKGEQEVTWDSTLDQGVLLFYDASTASNDKALAKVFTNSTHTDKVLTLKNLEGTLIPRWEDGGSSREIEDQIKKLEAEVERNSADIAEATDRAKAASEEASEALAKAEKAEDTATEALSVADAANEKAEQADAKATKAEDGVKNNADSIASNTGKIKQLESSEEALNVRVTALENGEGEDIARLEGQLKELQNSITSLDSTIASQEATIKDLTKQISETSTEVEEVDGELDTVKEDLKRTSESIDVLKPQVTNAVSDATAAKADAGEALAEAEKANAAAEAADTKIITLQTTVNNQESEITNVKADVKANTETATKATEDAKSAKETADATDAKVVTLQTTVATVKETADSTKKNLDNLEANPPWQPKDEAPEEK